MITNSMYYNGYKAHQIKQGDGDFVLQPYESMMKLYIDFNIVV